jgi:hypothetical protein
VTPLTAIRIFQKNANGIIQQGIRPVMRAQNRMREAQLNFSILPSANVFDGVKPTLVLLPVGQTYSIRDSRDSGNATNSIQQILKISCVLPINPVARYFREMDCTSWWLVRSKARATDKKT